jgi:hypothetical protein
LFLLLGNALKLVSVFPNRIKTASAFVIGIFILSTMISGVTLASALTPPVVDGEYYEDHGVLDTDTYTLYPWEKESINVGFSQYGEMISEDTPLGLEYNGIDVFASSVVDPWQWSNGWLMDIHWVDNGLLKNVWAYALYTDWNVAGVDGAWMQMQKSFDASAAGDTDGGRRTSGWATSDSIRCIYDGPRKAIYLLKTTIYDKDPGQGGFSIVELTIQLVFDKVMKYVMEIKDIKRIADEKIQGPLQIEFSQRAEWDLGDSKLNNAKTYAEFYDNLATKYDKHPFYPTDKDVTYDLCQMINPETKLVGFAAFWPNLISKWVTGTDTLPRIDLFQQEDKLTSLETFNHVVTIPTDPTESHPYIRFYGGKTWIFLPYEPVMYPRGAGEWSNTPWVFVKNDLSQWVQLLQTSDWRWKNKSDFNGTAPPGVASKAVMLTFPQIETYGKDYLILYKMEMKGDTKHTNIEPLPCTCPDLFEGGVYKPSYGMYAEPAVPYVMGEWDFELSMDHRENSTHQFRCVSVYGLTDLNNAVDPNMNPGGEAPKEFMIDSEVQYQLNEIFNPYDLVDAVEKDTFRWCQKGDLATTITLQAHTYDKYGNKVECLEQSLVYPEKWGYYCEDSEKVLLYDLAGALEPLLLERPDQYSITGWVVTLNTAKITDYSKYDYYKVLYSTRLAATPPPGVMEGRWEWVVVGETSHASDSIGSAMVASALEEWKESEVWISGLDIKADIDGPTMPWIMVRYATLYMDRRDYYYDYGEPGDYRTALRDDWSTPPDWDHEDTIYPYAISSGNVIVVGGPINSVTAEYFNDFTDALIYTNYGAGFYAPGCWARTSQPSLASLTHQGVKMNLLPPDHLWYDSDVVGDRYGYAIISAYKDLNETQGFIVYGYTAEDTYWACYALQGGGAEWLQLLQPGVTTVVLEMDYNSIHPVKFHVKECLGPFTECTGAFTSFKTSEYYSNIACGMAEVEQEAHDLGICYKLVELDFCAQVHPDS